MNEAKNVLYNSRDLLKKLLVISFTFLLLQIVLTNILLFLIPKLYSGYGNGFTFEEDIIFYLIVMISIFVVVLITYILSYLVKSSNA